MKRRLLSLILLLVMVCALSPWVGATEYDVTEAIPLYYDEMWKFREGIAPVRLKKKWGFVDTSGKAVGAYKYDSVSWFHNGLAEVRLDGKEGLLDAEGRTVVPCKYDSIMNLGNRGDLIAVELDGKWGFINESGNEVIPCQYENETLWPEFSEGLAAVKKDGKWGYIDTSGNVVIPFQYAGAESFSNGFAIVRRRFDNKRDLMYGFIDHSGNEVVPCKYVYAWDCEEPGIATVLESNWQYDLGMVDMATGQEIIPCEYPRLWYAGEGLILADTPDGKTGYFDTKGNLVVPFCYSYGGSFSEGLAVVKMGGQVGFIDPTGQEVVPCDLPYTTAENLDHGVSVVTRSTREGIKWGLIDRNGREIVECKYDEETYIPPLDEGIVSMHWNGKYGYVNIEGREIVPPQYDYTHEFSEGYGAVRLNGKYGYVDQLGQEVTAIAYDHALDVSDGLAVVERDGKWGALRFSKTTKETGVVASPSTQPVLVNGVSVEFQCYALKDANGNDTNYIKLRDVASILSGSAVQFNVVWDGAVNIETGKDYVPNGSEMKTPFRGDRAYETATAETRINGKAAALDAIVLKDDNGGAYTYYKLRDLGTALGFTVDWSADKGIFIETK